MVCDGSELLLAQRVVVLDSLDFILELLDPAQDMHVLLLQDTQPQLIPQHSDPAQLPNQHLHLHMLKYRELVNCQFQLRRLEEGNKSPAPYLLDHNGVSGGEGVHDLAVAVLHHGLVLDGTKT